MKKAKKKASLQNKRTLRYNPSLMNSLSSVPQVWSQVVDKILNCLCMAHLSTLQGPILIAGPHPPTYIIRLTHHNQTAIIQQYMDLHDTSKADLICHSKGWRRRRNLLVTSELTVPSFPPLVIFLRVYPKLEPLELTAENTAACSLFSLRWLRIAKMLCLTIKKSAKIMSFLRFSIVRNRLQNFARFLYIVQVGSQKFF